MATANTRLMMERWFIMIVLLSQSAASVLLLSDPSLSSI